MLPGSMVAMAALPWMRCPHSGVGLLLSRAPQPGWAGAALNALDLAAGGWQGAGAQRALSRRAAARLRPCACAPIARAGSWLGRTGRKASGLHHL